MNKPTDKNELLYEANYQYQLLWDLINTMTVKEQNCLFLYEDRDKNIKDVLTHLYEWHMLLNKWYQIGMDKNKIPSIPEEGYNWRQLKSLNNVLWEKHQNTTLSQAKELLMKSHLDIIKLIDTHDNHELFNKYVYPWTKSTTLADYFIANSSNHYIWAQKKIKKQKRLIKKMSSSRLTS